MTFDPAILLASFRLLLHRVSFLKLSPDRESVEDSILKLMDTENKGLLLILRLGKVSKFSTHAHIQSSKFSWGSSNDVKVLRPKTNNSAY